jgi:hypothetical protein
VRLARFKRPAQTQVARHPRERAATDQVNERRCEQRRLRRAVRIVRRRPTMPSEASERARGPHRDAEDHARRLASRSRTTAARSRPASHATAHRGTAGEAQPLTVARAAGRATSWSSTRPRHASTGAPARHATSHNAPGANLDHRLHPPHRHVRLRGAIREAPDQPLQLPTRTPPAPWTLQRHRTGHLTHAITGPLLLHKAPSTPGCRFISHASRQHRPRTM